MLLNDTYQLEAVVTDTGNISALEDSTPQLAFASQIWTYMTSHILVRGASAFLHLSSELLTCLRDRAYTQ